ncbi:MAG: hypothetical protein HY688_04115 [Chloroflexi bacterium]|nr:hypothetical protein [Chloroflexota bacterium]
MAQSARLPAKERAFARALLKAAISLQENRLREAVSEFRRVAENSAAPSRSEKLRLLTEGVIHTWGLAAALYAMTEGLMPRNLEATEYGVEQFIAARRFASKIGLPQTAGKLAKQVGTEGMSALVAKAQLRGLTEQETGAVEEFNTAVRLLAIEDPFEGWQALSEEMTKVWPKGVSAVDAIREQRE